MVKSQQNKIELVMTSPGNLQTDKDSKNSTTLKNGSSSKTFLTDTLGRGGGGGGGPGNANATTGSSDNLVWSQLFQFLFELSFG